MQKLEIGTFYVFKNHYDVLNKERAFELAAVPRHTNFDNTLEHMNKGIHILKRSDATSGSRFGMSLINLGRLDGDKYEDFAVGAPGADSGLGAIYIYRGSKHFWAEEKDRNGMI